MNDIKLRSYHLDNKNNLSEVDFFKTSKGQLKNVRNQILEFKEDIKLEPKIAFNFISSGDECFLNNFCLSTSYNWPKEHGLYLLTCGSECARATWSLLDCDQETMQVHFFDTETEIKCPKSMRQFHLLSWLRAISLSVLTRDKETFQLLVNINSDLISLDIDYPDMRVIDLAFFNLFQAFFKGEKDQSKQASLIKGVMPYLSSSSMKEICEGNGYWQEYYQWLIFPLYSLVAVAWGYDDTSLDEAVALSIDANYEYYAYIDPSYNGGLTGDKSLSLKSDGAKFHLSTTAFLVKHFEQTGETVSFDSKYTPQWLIKGDGPTREEVINNPPIFEEQYVFISHS